MRTINVFYFNLVLWNSYILLFHRCQWRDIFEQKKDGSAISNNNNQMIKSVMQFHLNNDIIDS